MSIPLIIVICCWLTAHALPFKSQNIAEINADYWRDEASESYDKIFVKRGVDDRNDRRIKDFHNHMTPVDVSDEVDTTGKYEIDNPKTSEHSDNPKTAILATTSSLPSGDYHSIASQENMKKSWFDGNIVTNCALSFLNYLYNSLKINVGNPFFNVLSNLPNFLSNLPDLLSNIPDLLSNIPNFGLFGTQTEDDETSGEDSESAEINSYDDIIRSEYT